MPRQCSGSVSSVNPMQSLVQEIPIQRVVRERKLVQERGC